MEVVGSQQSPHNKTLEGEFLLTQPTAALGEPSLISPPWALGPLAAVTIPYSPSIPRGSWKELRILRTRKPSFD